jgi:hypothetical protein
VRSTSVNADDVMNLWLATNGRWVADDTLYQLSQIQSREDGARYVSQYIYQPTGHDRLSDMLAGLAQWLDHSIVCIVAEAICQRKAPCLASNYNDQEVKAVSDGTIKPGTLLVAHPLVRSLRARNVILVQEYSHLLGATGLLLNAPISGLGVACIETPMAQLFSSETDSSSPRVLSPSLFLGMTDRVWQSSSSSTSAYY